MDAEHQIIARTPMALSQLQLLAEAPVPQLSIEGGNGVLGVEVHVMLDICLCQWPAQAPESEVAL